MVHIVNIMTYSSKSFVTFKNHDQFCNRSYQGGRLGPYLNIPYQSICTRKHIVDSTQRPGPSGRTLVHHKNNIPYLYITVWMKPSLALL